MNCHTACPNVGYVAGRVFVREGLDLSFAGTRLGIKPTIPRFARCVTPSAPLCSATESSTLFSLLYKSTSRFPTNFNAALLPSAFRETPPSIRHNGQGRYVFVLWKETLPHLEVRGSGSGGCPREIEHIVLQDAHFGSLKTGSAAQLGRGQAEYHPGGLGFVPVLVHSALPAPRIRAP